jgi:hypothetical protein
MFSYFFTSFRKVPQKNGADLYLPEPKIFGPRNRTLPRDRCLPQKTVTGPEKKGAPAAFWTPKIPLAPENDPSPGGRKTPFSGRPGLAPKMTPPAAFWTPKMAAGPENDPPDQNLGSETENLGSEIENLAQIPKI